MEVFLLVMAVLFVAFVALGVFATVKAVGAAKRGVDRTISNARRTVEDSTLRVRSAGLSGTAGELAQLRLRLRTSMRATQDALHAAVTQDASLKESIGLFERLSAHGLELEDELRQLERDPDRARVAEALTELRERTDRITHAADSLRWAVRDRARNFAEDDLAALSAQIDVETGALRHWSSAAEPGPEPGPWTGEERRQRQGERYEERRRTEPTGPGPGASGPRASDGATPGGASDDGPQAIEAPDPRLRATHPWQKRPADRPRPEPQPQRRPDSRPEATN
ncbi:hypothetical protein ACWEJP_20135 [Streptomyces sp. NPDC004749]